VDRERLESAGLNILKAFGRTTTEEGLERTPERFANFFLEDVVANGVEDPKEMLRSAVFKEDYKGMIVENGLSFYSLCEHHLVPFFGTATIGYIPNGKILGLSKLPRVLRAFALGPNVQERITIKVASAIEEVLEPLGIGVILRATHLCMSARGVRAETAVTTTSVIKGVFKSGGFARDEFLRLSKLS